jgi:hypothetical protein
MTDLERLRESCTCCSSCWTLRCEAADEIEQLRLALSHIVKHIEAMGGSFSEYSSVRLIARRALGEVQ